MKILIADAQEKVRHALTVLLQEQPGWEIVGFAEDAADLAEKLVDFRPDVTLLDWNLPGLARKSGSLSRWVPGNARIIAMSAKPEQKQEALQSGADYFISKVDSPNRLIEVIVRCGESSKR